MLISNNIDGQVCRLCDVTPQAAYSSKDPPVSTCF